VQVLEQMENNILIRPLTLYSGPELRSYGSISTR
jgi:citrate synthase